MNLRHHLVIGSLVLGILPGVVGAQESYNPNNRYRVFNRQRTNAATTQQQVATPAQSQRQQGQPQVQQQVRGERLRGVGPGGTVLVQQQGGQPEGRRGGQPTQVAGRGPAGTGVPGAPSRGAGQPMQLGGAPGGGSSSGSGANAFTMVGRIPEVSKGMVESLRTRRIDFDSSKAATKPNIILLGPRRYQPTEQTAREESSLARPL